MFQQTTDRKTALFLADGCEEIEALTVADLLFRAGIPCTKVSITDSLSVTSSHDITIQADTTIDRLNFEEYDMLILPGGMPGTTNELNCKALTDQVKSFAGRAAEGKMVAAICAAPSILAKLGLLNGKQATCNPSVTDILEENGAKLRWTRVAVDGNIITSQAMGTAIPFALAIVEQFLGHKTARKLAENVIYW